MLGVLVKTEKHAEQIQQLIVKGHTIAVLLIVVALAKLQPQLNQPLKPQLNQPLKPQLKLRQAVLSVVAILGQVANETVTL